jgi:polyphenol oxidase
MVSEVHRFGSVCWTVSQRGHGDFCPDRVASDLLLERQRALVDLPWTMVDQVHGTTAVEVTTPGQTFPGTADVVATSVPGAVISIWAGDCLPLLLSSSQGRIVMAHVGWRGLAAGVVESALSAVMTTTASDGTQIVGSADSVQAVIGPHIGPCCYDFSPSDIEYVATSIGVDPAQLSSGRDPHRSVLDMGAAVTHLLRRAGIEKLVFSPGPQPVCTGCDGRWFSHRTRTESERHVMAAWMTQ